MCKRFKATILSNYRESTFSSRPLPNEFVFYKTVFSTPKNYKITPNDIYLSPFDKGGVSDKTHYTLDRVFNAETNNYDYEISFSGTKKYLKLNWYNKVKLMYIHERFWMQKNASVIYTTILSAILSAIFTLIVGRIAYKWGYSNGIEDSKQHTTIQKKEVNLK